MESNSVDMEGMNMDFPKIHESEYRLSRDELVIAEGTSADSYTAIEL